MNSAVFFLSRFLLTAIIHSEVFIDIATSEKVDWDGIVFITAVWRNKYEWEKLKDHDAVD